MMQPMSIMLPILCLPFQETQRELQRELAELWEAAQRLTRHLARLEDNIRTKEAALRVERSCAEIHGRCKPPPLARSRSHLDRVSGTAAGGLRISVQRWLSSFSPPGGVAAETADSPPTRGTVLTLSLPPQVLLLGRDRLRQDRAAADHTPGHLTSQECTYGCGCRGMEL